MDAAARRGLDGLGAAVDILWGGSLKAANDGILGSLRDLIHRVKIAFRRDGESRLDDVNSHLIKHLGDLELLLVGHGGAG